MPAPADARQPPRSGRRLALLLWPALLLYFGAVIWRAHGELTAEYTVRGLFRDYARPRSLPIGTLFDPRQGDLAAEIDARYGSAGPPVTEDGIAAWQAALRARGFEASATTGVGEGEPRLVFMPAGPWLIVNRSNGRFVTFDPQRGMISLHEGVVAPDTPALRLSR